MKTLITYNRSNVMTLAWDFITVLGMDKARAMHRAWSIARQQREDFLVTGELRVVNAYTPCCIMVCEDDVAGLVTAHVEAAIAWDKENINLDLVAKLNAKLNDSRLTVYIQQRQGKAATIVAACASEAPVLRGCKSATDLKTEAKSELAQLELREFGYVTAPVVAAPVVSAPTEFVIDDEFSKAGW